MINGCDQVAYTRLNSFVQGVTDTVVFGISYDFDVIPRVPSATLQKTKCLIFVRRVINDEKLVLVL